MSTARLILTAKALRGFGDGFTALLLPLYLTGLGLTLFQVGLVTTAALLGSAMLTLAVGLAGHRVAKLGFQRKRIQWISGRKAILRS